MNAQAFSDFSTMTFLFGFLIGSMATLVILLSFEAIKAYNSGNIYPSFAAPKPVAKKTDTKKKK